MKVATAPRMSRSATAAALLPSSVRLTPGLTRICRPSFGKSCDRPEMYPYVTSVRTGRPEFRLEREVGVDEGGGDMDGARGPSQWEISWN